jgi:agmatine deiminase
MPAEWEKHEATWLSWPVNKETWPGEKISATEIVFAKMIYYLSHSEKVRINLLTDQKEQDRIMSLLTRENVLMDEVTFYPNKSNDAWCRDHGPIFVRDRQGKKVITNWEYNAWGGKYLPFDDDNRLPASIAGMLSYPIVSPGIILEGGSLDVNGKGTLLTTRSCLLNKNRNPHLTRKQIEEYLHRYLGATNILWLGEGVVGDDTDGHVDDISRFINRSTIVTMIETNKDDDNYLPLKENADYLKKMTDQDGQLFEIIELPMPSPLITDGLRLPASYSNFYISNKYVLVPVFNDKNDDKVLSILQSLFKDREVIGIDCRDLIWGQGAIHCVTQQEIA